MITLTILVIAILLIANERQRRKIKTLAAENARYKNNKMVFMKARRHGHAWMAAQIQNTTPEQFEKEYMCKFTPTGKNTNEVPE